MTQQALKIQVTGQGAAADAQKYAKYTKEATVKETQIVDAPYHSTLCSTCCTVCHHRCGLVEITTPGQLDALHHLSTTIGYARYLCLQCLLYAKCWLLCAVSYFQAVERLCLRLPALARGVTFAAHIVDSRRCWLWELLLFWL